MRDTFAALERDVVACERCPRLRAWCQGVAKERVKRFREETYWGRPVPGFGDKDASLWIVGLAPAAHGGNRTGRVFTGDRSGDFLFAALHRAHFASSPLSTRRDDGLRLSDCYISPIVRCAPPDNKPSREETALCRDYLGREWELLPNLRAILVLGHLALSGFLAMYKERHPKGPRRLPFGHGLRHDLGDGVSLFTSYHPSQQNTFTGRLTKESFDRLLREVRAHLGRA
jgi:uracil-DNA glycosylase family 4